MDSDFLEYEHLAGESFASFEKVATDPQFKWESLGEEQGVSCSRMEGGSSAPKAVLQFTGKSQYQFGDVTKSLFGKIWGIQPESKPIETIPSNESQVFVMRGDTIMNASPQKIVDALADLDNRGKWDELFESREIVKMIRDEGNGTFPSDGIQSFQGIGPPNSLVSPRDFATLTAAKFDKTTGKSILLSKSIHNPDIPEKEGYVRADLLNSGYIVEPIDEQKTQSKVTYIVQLDPKGWIPMPVVAMVAKQQPLTLAKLKKFIDSKP